MTVSAPAVRSVSAPGHDPLADRLRTALRFGTRNGQQKTVLTSLRPVVIGWLIAALSRRYAE